MPKVIAGPNRAKAVSSRGVSLSVMMCENVWDNLGTSQSYARRLKQE